MSSLQKILCGTALGLLLAAAITPANAGTVFESATYTGNDTGEYILSENDLIGAAFTLTKTTTIWKVGAQFGGFPGGDIFAAIVPLASPTSFPGAPSDQLSSISLADVEFSVPTAVAVDLKVKLPTPLTLGPGSYAVIFGSGQFGATGFAGLGDENDPSGTPFLFRSFFSTDWAEFDDNGVRLDVSSTPIPAALPLFASGLGALGLIARRRAKKRA